MRSTSKRFPFGRCMRLLTLGLLLAGALQVTAQDEEDIDFSEMSLEDLLNVEVVTASKKAESQWDAPGVVTSFTSREIQTFGANNLWDALDKMPGINYSFSIMDYATVRGSNGWGFQNHHLMLIDGRPVRTSAGNISIYNPLSALPLIGVERIEVVRGPGSVLYGTNGFFGVINIITKQADEEGTVVGGGIKGGSFGTSIVEVSFQHKKGDLSFSGSGLFNDTDGWDSETADNVDGHLYSREAFEETEGFNLSLHYKGFKGGLFFGDNKRWANHWETVENGFFDSTAPYFRDTRVWQLRLEYDIEINENWTFTPSITRTDEEFAWADTNGVAFDLSWPNQETVIEGTLFGSIGEKFNMLAGVTHTTTELADSPSLPDFEEKYSSLYFQLTYDINDKVKLIGGGQYVKALDVVLDGKKESRFVPRVGTIINFNENAGVKLLFSEAFRNAPADVKLIDNDIEYGNPDLESETIETVDLQFYYHMDKFQGALTYFINQEDNLILSRPDADGRGVYQNIGERETTGIEVETKFVPNEKWYILASITTQDNEDNAGTDDTTLQPNMITKLGLNYNAENWGVGVFDVFSDDPPDNSILFGSDVIDTNPAPSSFNYVTVNFNYHFGNGFKIEANVVNLLDEEIYTPADIPIGSVDNSYQGRPERGYYASIKYRY